jgi:hypothetical protein
MALAEAGWPQEAKQCTLGPAVATPGKTIWFSPDIPLAIIWQTAEVTGGSIPCWSCFEATRLHRDSGIAIDCLEGKCRNPDGEKRPPRELLQQVSNRQAK